MTMVGRAFNKAGYSLLKGARTMSMKADMRSAIAYEKTLDKAIKKGKSKATIDFHRDALDAVNRNVTLARRLLNKMEKANPWVKP